MTLFGAFIFGLVVGFMLSLIIDWYFR